MHIWKLKLGPAKAYYTTALVLLTNMPSVNNILNKFLTWRAVSQFSDCAFLTINYVKEDFILIFSTRELPGAIVE